MFIVPFHNSVNLWIKIAYVCTNAKGNSNINITIVECLFVGICIDYIGTAGMRAYLQQTCGEEKSQKRVTVGILIALA